MSSQGATVTHYEVYTLDDQRWILHAHFPADQREAALAEAKQIERNLNAAAKVVREVYYPGSNSCDETVVYVSDKSLRDAAAARSAAASAARARSYARSGGGGGGGSASAAASAAAAIDREKATRSFGLLLKLSIVIATALVVAGAVAGVLSAFADKLPHWGVALSEDGLSLLLFATFVVTFLSTAVPLAISFINLDTVAAPPRRPAQPAPRPQPHPLAVKPKPAAKPVAELVAEMAAAEEIAPPPVVVPPPPPEEGAPLIPELPPAVVAPEDVEPGAETEKEVAPPDPMEGLKMAAMRYLSSLLTTVKTTRPQLDAFNKFGVDLVLAGAIDVLGNQNSLALAEKRVLLSDVIEVMGTKGDTAKAFANSFESYLSEPRYMVMVQAGRSSMEAFLVGAESPTEQMIGAFEAWNKPQTGQAQARIVTVLFTDMVGSTDMTQSRGDQAAQDIVRRHNSIVRAALAEFAGKEVKHTGDGIMASFASTSNGVEAAVAIQRAVARHNLRHKDQSLHLRIGINAGEPIEEEDDLFGTTVQLAARVCAQAHTDQILCTNVVRELSAGKGIDFVDKGSHELKGFKDTITLYEALWDGKVVEAVKGA